MVEVSLFLFCNNPSFSSSLPLKVLQERYVWAEDAGRSWGCVDVCALWSEAYQLALQRHSVQELHREVAHMRANLYLNKLISLYGFYTRQ